MLKESNELVDNSGDRNEMIHNQNISLNTDADISIGNGNNSLGLYHNTPNFHEFIDSEFHPNQCNSQDDSPFDVSQIDFEHLLNHFFI